MLPGRTQGLFPGVAQLVSCCSKRPRVPPLQLRAGAVDTQEPEAGPQVPLAWQLAVALPAVVAAVEFVSGEVELAGIEAKFAEQVLTP